MNEPHPTFANDPSGNIGARLARVASERPKSLAVAEPAGRDANGRRRYRTVTFRELDADSNAIAAGLQQMGVPRGARLVLLVRPSIDFIALVFAMFKAGVVTVLIDPGMGRQNLVRCLEEAQPEGFIAISPVQAMRTVLRRRFPKSRFHVTVGRRWFWGGVTLARLRRTPLGDWMPARTTANDPAAIIFTTGSTGPPKGVLYRHGNFEMQVDEIRERYGIQPGEIDLPGFPLFGLFNAVMGVSTIIPDMDATRPAQVNPRHIIEHVEDWQVTQSFGSPALWNTVGVHCEEHGVRLPTLRRVLSAGAPVPPHVLRRIRQMMHPDGEVFTPYGATESLPVASIESREVLEETAAKSAVGAGTCVGRRFANIEWRVIQISDEPLATIDQTRELPRGEIGEIIVRGPVVTSEYVTRVEANALHKIDDGETRWHRIGDVGYLDEQDRFWFCGRKAHRVLTAAGPMYTIPCEAIFNQHPQVYRCALVGVGPAHQQRPVIVVETWPSATSDVAAQRKLLDELRGLAATNPLTSSIVDFLWHPALPVDIRHNAKIFREQLAIWAAQQLANGEVR